MITLALYCQLPGAQRPSRVFQAALRPDQAMGVLADALNQWAASARAPRAILEQGNISRIISLPLNYKETL